MPAAIPTTPHAAAPGDAAETLLMTMTMPADIDASGQVPTGWLLARMDLAGAVLPGRHFRAPVYLRGLSDVVLHERARLGQCITFKGCIAANTGSEVVVAIDAFSEERGRPVAVHLMSARLRYALATVEVPGNLFPGTFPPSGG